MKKGKKIILFVSMVLVLAVAAVLNITLLAANNDNLDDGAMPTGFFATSRQDRIATRTYEIDQLNDIINLEGDEYANARQSAIAQKQAIVDAMENELLLETLIKGLGYEDVLVSISTTSDGITIIIDKDELVYEDTVKIYYVIQERTSLSSDYVNFLAI